MRLNKRGQGDVLNPAIIQIILIAAILGMFLMATAGKINGRGVKQQILEKEVALLIDSATPGMGFEILKVNAEGLVGNVRVENGRIFISVDGLASFKGQPYFSKYKVSVLKEPDKFVVRIG